MQWRWLSVLVVTAVVVPPLAAPARAAPPAPVVEGVARVAPVELTVDGAAGPSTLAGAGAAVEAGLFTADAVSFAPRGEELSLSLRQGGDTNPQPSACAWPAVEPFAGVAVGRRCAQVSVAVADSRAAGGAAVPELVVSSSVLGGLGGRLLAARGTELASRVEAALRAVASPTGDLVGPVLAQLRPDCADAVEAAPPAGADLTSALEQVRSGPADSIAAPVDAIVAAHADAGDPLPSSCRVVADLLAPSLVDAVGPDAVVAAAATALVAADAALLTVEVGRVDGVEQPRWASAEVQGGRTGAMARADSPPVRVVLGSLAPAAAGLDAHLGTEVDRLVALVASLVAGVPGTTVPTATGVRAAAAAALDLPAWLTAEADAVVAEVAAGGTDVRRTTAEVETGVVPATVRLTVAPDLAAVLGVATVTDVGPGEVVEVLPGSPWRTRVRGGTAATATSDGGGTEAATLALFDDAVVLAVGTTSAGLTTFAPGRAGPVVAPTALPTSEELPAAGAGAATLVLGAALAAAALGWSALGGRVARGSRRR